MAFILKSLLLGAVLATAMGCGTSSAGNTSTGSRPTGSPGPSAPVYPGTVFFGDSITCGFGGDNTFSGGGSFTDGGFASIVRDALGGTSTLTIQSLYGLPSTVMALRLPVPIGVHHLVVKNNSPLVGGTVRIEWVAAPKAGSTASPLPLVSALSTIHSVGTSTMVATSPVGQ